MLHISKLDLRYGEIQAVESVDIEINLGEIVSITGANGAGKSSV
ncbi:MAG: ABC transporter ATP-binding protein, partial [Rhodospirillaceae bacterium]